MKALLEHEIGHLMHTHHIRATLMATSSPFTALKKRKLT
ncbi:hypothetical protein [Vibrio cyclitrophicus]